MLKVNNHGVEIYDGNEVVIHLNPKMIEANQSKVYLTRRELLEMVDLLDGTLSKCPDCILYEEPNSKCLANYCINEIRKGL